jgi:membrane protein YqaA with SNARE-associated domain
VIEALPIGDTLRDPTRGGQMLRRIYDATIALSTHRRAVPALGVVSFIESSVFPIPPDAMMVPMILARPDRAWIIAGVATIASVLGGIAGYAIGMFAFEQIGRPVLEALGKADAMAEFSTQFNDAGFWAVLIAGLTPFPYKVITIMSGWTGMSLATFVATSVFARGLRFFIVAALLRVYGEPIRAFIERRLGLVFTLALAVLIGGFLMVRWL